MCTHVLSDPAQTKWPAYLLDSGCQGTRSSSWRVPPQRAAGGYVIPCTTSIAWQLAASAQPANTHPDGPEGLLRGCGNVILIKSVRSKKPRFPDEKDARKTAVCNGSAGSKKRHVHSNTQFKIFSAGKGVGNGSYSWEVLGGTQKELGVASERLIPETL